MAIHGLCVTGGFRIKWGSEVKLKNESFDCSSCLLRRSGPAGRGAFSLEKPPCSGDALRSDRGRLEFVADRQLPNLGKKPAGAKRHATQSD